MSAADDGSVLIVVALSMTALLGVVALVVDVGELLVRRTALQNGVDAAAIAIARGCADHAVSPTVLGCNDAMAQDIADDYASKNEGADADVDPNVSWSYSGKAGRVTVTSSAGTPPVFAAFLGLSDDQTVSATATARWGPLTAIDHGFPLAVCKGALPDPGGDEIVLEATTLGGCDGAPDEPLFGWVPPDDPTLCSTNITVLPSSYLDVGSADTPPGGTVCNTLVDELFNDLTSSQYCHWSVWRGYHCHESTTPPEHRTRVLAVYDPTRGTADARPSYSLIAFEFTALRIDGREEHVNGSAVCSAGEVCLRGRVVEYVPPDDGPIVDPALAALPGIEDTTVLDVRLVD